jgi:hypothetical protein
MNHSTQPALAPPGAGIPMRERWISGIGIKLLARFATRDEITRRFTEEGERAVELARGLTEDKGRRRVLIPRIRGIEDSSRNWSVYMTLLHLVIINTAIAGLIQRLCAGRETLRSVRIEDAKPDEEAGPELADQLEALIARYGEIVTSHGDLRTAKRHPHPWFGALDALQWHALAALHARIHRKQIEQIIERLKGAG